MLAAEPVADDSEVPVEAAVVDLADAVDLVADTLTVEPTAGGAEDAAEAGAKTAMGSALGDWRLELVLRVGARS